MGTNTAALVVDFKGSGQQLADAAGQALEEPDVTDRRGQVDVAHMVIPAKFVPMAVEDCGKKGVKHIIINSGGFSETGPEGAEIEKAFLEKARQYGIRIFGPNCQGVMNTDAKVSLYSNFTFARMTPGHISMVCQGGGVAEVINNYFGMWGIGQRMYASNGNACDIYIPEIIRYLADDDGGGVNGGRLVVADGVAVDPNFLFGHVDLDPKFPQPYGGPCKCLSRISRTGGALRHNGKNSDA